VSGAALSLRGALRGRLRALVGSGEVSLGRSPGDDGLFGPGSGPWRVHGDLTAMMIGGVSALLLQMLHPGALAGVWDHSDFRRDRLGRLKRTAQFIGLTTFGGTATAEAAIARVRRVHGHVHGHLPDGTPYAADDPALLTWVHVAEVDSFLRAHLVYRDPAMPGAMQDSYLADYALVARRLGATDVPASRREIADYYEAIRPQLVCDERTRAVAEALLRPDWRDPAMAAALLLVGQAGIDLLPPWAAALHGRARRPAARPAIRAATRTMARTVRWAMAG
jgi:uncharacterized protein (DUF2236 family)